MYKPLSSLGRGRDPPGKSPQGGKAPSLEGWGPQVAMWAQIYILGKTKDRYASILFARAVFVHARPRNPDTENRQVFATGIGG